MEIMHRDEILVIGTEPPCPRCDYLTRMVQDIVNTMGLTRTVRHFDYTSDEAHRIAAEFSLVPGTAKDVARIAGLAIDWNTVQELIANPGERSDALSEKKCCAITAAQWSPALDEALSPCERKARESGILMTPILIVNGRLVHQGSVPSREQTENWIRGIGNEQGHREDRRCVVEVLGPGCPKCEKLYQNVEEALRRAGLKEHITVVKRTDIRYFQQMGVNLTPGLIINGRLVSKGRVLEPEQIVAHLDKGPPAWQGVAHHR